MQSQRVDIDRTGFITRILHSGRTARATPKPHATWPETAAGDSRDLTGGYGLTAGFSELTFAQNQLNARELQAITALRDDALRRNLEQGNFENTLIDLFSAAAGRDLEEFALLADSTLTYGNDDVLCQTDGWVSRAANKLYGVGAGAAFDPAADDFPENMFSEMLDVLPKQYLANPGDWKYYVTWDVYDGYRDCLRARGTQLGDSAQTTNMPLYYKGTQIVYCPFLERAAAPTAYGAVNDGTVTGEIALLTNPDNMVWGVFHEVQIEREREAKWRRTDFVLAFEGDADYEDENAAVASFIEKTKP
jgi:hypothetical protein